MLKTKFKRSFQTAKLIQQSNQQQQEIVKNHINNVVGMVLQRIVRSNSRNKLTATLFHNIAYYVVINL